MHSSPSASPCRSHAPGASALTVLSVLAWLLVMVASPVAADPGQGRWRWPMDPPHHVLHGFEQPEHRYAAGHRGVDISAPGGVGTPVRAVEAGTVRFAGEVAGRGVVSVLHADGLLSTYEPVAAVVAAGEHVAEGSLLGHVAQVRVGAPHCPEGPCLHLGARRGEDYLDPMLLLGARGPSVLLPLGGSGGSGSVPAGSGPGSVRPSNADRPPASVPAARTPLHGTRWVLAD